MNVSVVIITKNEASNIVECILSAKKISDDIIVVDSGSTDATLQLAATMQVNIQHVFWNGYGNVKNEGAAFAKHDWIFSLDADERITDELASLIRMLDLNDPSVIYGFRRLNFFANKLIRFGEGSRDHVYRIYNRTHVRWNTVPVHEALVGDAVRKHLIISHILHYSMKSARHYMQKKKRYAYLAALKYKEANKKYAGILQYISPVFHFLKSYIFQLGFLDKGMGLTIAKISASYTRQKYGQLHRMMKEEKRVYGEMNFIRASLKRITSFLS